MKIIDSIFKKQQLKEEDYATADESLVSEDDS
jgi:hypothetical protein